MARYFTNRLLLVIPTLIAISLIIFIILAIAPGDPMGEFANNPAITADYSLGRGHRLWPLGLDGVTAGRVFGTATLHAGRSDDDGDRPDGVFSAHVCHRAAIDCSI